MLNTLDAEWRSFESGCIPKEAPEIQRIEMRRAFYAGIESFLVLQCNAANHSDAACVALMEGWHSELKDFVLQVKAGLA